MQTQASINCSATKNTQWHISQAVFRTEQSSTASFLKGTEGQNTQTCVQGLGYNIFFPMDVQEAFRRGAQNMLKMSQKQKISVKSRIVAFNICKDRVLLY